MFSMAIKIMFISPTGDRAIVKRGDKQYILDLMEGLDVAPLPDVNFSHFVIQLGYCECGIIFWSIKDAHTYLAAQRERYCTRAGIEIPARSALIELIKDIDIANANRYLDRIENELLPHGRYLIAKEIAQSLHAADAVQLNPVTLARIDKILEICSNEN